MSEHLNGWVADLTDIGRGDLVVAGGKGANLGELMLAGFPVPPGFVITTNAYRDALIAAGLDAMIEERTTATHLTDADADAVREAIEGMTIGTSLEAEVVAAYRSLGSGAVAVRSSATAEDLPGATFAGQQDTYLNIIGEADLVASVRRCWASLWTRRAVAYRDRAEIDHRSVRIAVVVQRMVNADTAGVMFTANPVTGVRDEIVIDASPGLGEAVVSGRVTPDHFVVGADGGIRQRRPGRREVVIRAKAGGGVTEEADDAAAAHLEDAVLRSLAETGARIAAHFGGPQDIEWAVAGDSLSIVQARPLTAVPPAPEHVNRLRRTIAGIVAELLPVRPFPLDMTTWTVHGHGRILTRMLAEIPALRLSMTDVLPEVDGIVDRVAPPDPRPTIRTPATPFRMIPRIRRFRSERWTSDPRFVAFDREVNALGRTDPTQLAWADLLAVPQRALDVLDGLITLRIDYLPRVGYNLLRLRILLALFGQGREFSALTRGARSRTTDANDALGALAGMVAGHARWRDALVERSDTELTGLLASSAEFEPLRLRVDAFLGEYGHRETTSAFLASQPTWADDPAVLFGAVRALLAHREGSARTSAVSADASGPARDAERRILGRRYLRLLRTGRAIVAVAAEARSGIAFREDTHFHAMRSLPPLRRALLEAGSRLASAGAITQSGDVFHLRYDELRAIRDPDTLGDGQRAKLTALVQQRALARARRAGAPLISPLTLSAARADDDAVVIGIPAGGGRVTARVRVIRGPAEFSRLRTGEILVCPYTNPSWTPLFQIAAGVVVDSGGLASHAAIVAREYGLPTIMGAAGATVALRDGQIVTVDGGTGRVVVEEAT